MQPVPPSSRGRLAPLLAAPLLASLIAAPLLAGCSVFAPIPTERGTLVEDSDLKALVPGSSTRADVTQLLGSPTSRATFDDNTWIYVSEITQPVIMGRPMIDKQRVLVLNFDQGGTLRSFRKLNDDDAKDVAMVSRSTPSPGSQASFFQQLIGNVGRYNPASGLGGLGGLGSGSGFGSNAGYGHGGTGNTMP